MRETMVIQKFTRGNMNFAVGLIAGFTVCLVLSTFTMLPQSWQHQDIPGTAGYSGSGHMRDLLLKRYQKKATADSENARVVEFDDRQAHHDDDIVAKELSRRVRVLVWVMTSPQNLDKKAIHIRNTWAKRPNTMLFMSSTWNSSFPTIGLNVSEGREHLTAKTMQAFRYVYEHHFDDADWFMKADDDTYVIVENLRYLLSSYDPQDPIYFGHSFKVIVKEGYASGGAGYVMSKEALRRLATKGINNATLCKRDGGAEDAAMGFCLRNLGVRLVPSVDRQGNSRFHCFNPHSHLMGFYPAWYMKYDARGAKSGMDHISDYAVTFHYISSSRMYELEYFIYHLRPYGILSKFQNLNVNNPNSSRR